MVKLKFVVAILLLLVFVFSHVINSVDGRHLKVRSTKKSTKKSITRREIPETASRQVGEHTISTLHEDKHLSKMIAREAKEFWPAAPVHTVDNEAANPAVPLQDTTLPPSGHIDAFRPTAPGHSPGIGHSVHN